MLRNRARTSAHQSRQPLLHRHLSGDAVAWLHAHVRKHAGPSEYQDYVKCGLSRDRKIDSLTGILIYTGPVDEFFDFRYGKLPYRSLDFKHETLNKPVFQPEAVINYPNEHLYTRITEFKYLTGQEHAKTSIVYEIPAGRGRSILSRPTARKPCNVQEIQSTRGVDTRRSLRRAAGDLQVLQHGSVK